MATQSRRFVVVQDEAFQGATVPDGAKVIEVITDDATNELYDAVIAGSFAEVSNYNRVEIIDVDTAAQMLGQSSLTAGILAQLGDISTSGEGRPEDTYVTNVEAKLSDKRFGTQITPSFLPSTKVPQRVKGEGVISSSGSGSACRYSFKKDGQTQWQYRATPNYFGRVPDVLNRYSTRSQSNPTGQNQREDTYNRPGMLPLKNGNLLAFYTTGGTPLYTWTWISMLTNGSQAYQQGPGGYKPSTRIKLHMISPSEMLWSDSPNYEPNFTDQPELNSDPTSVTYNISGLDLVQFEDTEEVISIYGGWYGAAWPTPNSFLIVDVIKNNFGSNSESLSQYNDFLNSGIDTGTLPTDLVTEKRSEVRLNTPAGATTGITNKGDVSGIDFARYEMITGLTAEVLPTGRLAVGLATTNGLYSLVSDDRGATWRGSQIMDIRFLGSSTSTSTVVQRIASVDSCLTPDGQMVLLLVCNGINERGINADATKRRESVISLFVSGDGETYGAEKTLGNGTSTDYFKPAGALSSNDRNDLDEAVYALDGSVCLTSAGYIHVSVTSMKMGQPAGTHAQWIMTRTLSTTDLLPNADGQAVARSIEDVVQAVESPWGSRTHRLVPAYTNTANSNAQWTVPATIQNYLKAAYPATWAGPQLHNNGYVADGSSFGLDPSNTTSEYGGGPVYSNGPIEVATVNWRDQIMTMVSEFYTDMPLDFPDASDISSPALSFPPNTDAIRKAAVSVWRSNFHQPANVRIPTQIQVVAALLSSEGALIDKDRGGISQRDAATQGAWYNALYGSELGTNSYSVSWLASQFPPDVGFKETLTTDSATISAFVSPSQLGRMYVGGARHLETALSGEQAFYSYPEEFQTSSNPLPWQSDWAMPNAKSNAYKLQAGGASSWLRSGQGGLGFVCRVVLCLNKGEFVDPTGTGDPSPHIGAAVTLKDEPNSIEVSCNLHVSYGQAGTTAKNSFRIFLSDYDSRIATSEIYVASPNTDIDRATSDGVRNGWIEIIFGAEYKSTANQVHPFLLARAWDRGTDPDFLNDYVYASSLDTPLTNRVIDSSTTESVQFGLIRLQDSTAGTRKALFKSVQFARTFLKNESVKAWVTSGSTEQFPLGEEPYREALHQTDEPAMQMFQKNDAGLLNPMAPSQISSNPSQFLDRGVRVSFRGRATSNRRFTYEAVSRYPSTSLPNVPVGIGWRSAGTLVTRIVPTSEGAGKTTALSYSPAVEIVFDFGDPSEGHGIQPGAFALFGLNTPAFMMQLSNSTTWSNNPVNSPDPMYSVSPPGDLYHKAYHTIVPVYNTTSQYSWHPRYLFYAQQTEPGSGNSDSPGLSDIQYAIPSDGWTVRFFTNSTDPAAQVPFRPHQFRSQEGESYYLVCYDDRMYTDLQNVWDPSTGDPGPKDYVVNNQGGRWRHVYKIKDNTATTLTLTSQIGADLTTTAGLGKFKVGALAIMSDRVAFNVPQKAYSGSNDNASPDQFYRYLRIRLDGARFADPAEAFHKLAFVVAGKRIDLSNRDFDWGWRLGFRTGSTLTSLTTGERRHRKNHRPRRGWTVDYTPKPSEPMVIKQMGFDSTETNPQYQNFAIQNPQRGFGDPMTDPDQATAEGQAMRQDSQRSFLSRLSWEEIMDRVERLGVNGEVFALGFDAANMVYSTGGPHNTVWQQHPVLSDPTHLAAARIINFSGGTHRGYQGVERLSEGGGSNPNRVDVPAPVVAITGIEFSEEL